VDKDGGEGHRGADGQGQKNIYAIARRSHEVLVIRCGL
jgi:hypothetical protein